MKNKNGTLLGALAILFSTLVIALMPTEAEAEIYEDTLRLHILANSDSEEDQELKLKVRDRLLTEYGEMLKGESIGESVGIIDEQLSEIEEDVEEWIREYGYSYDASVTLSREWYDTREYEDFTLPKGEYTSLRVIIGDGEGKNWWCVMFPPLCLDIASERAPADDGISSYTDEEIRLISGKKYNIKFKILELISDTFAKNG
ncbi:MAG: stage II sporulation protein R [Clostridia bacterium]|nr:stage II sporulation protein R [Clostridia bacterium]